MKSLGSLIVAELTGTELFLYLLIVIEHFDERFPIRAKRRSDGWKYPSRKSIERTLHRPILYPIP